MLSSLLIILSNSMPPCLRFNFCVPILWSSFDFVRCRIVLHNVRYSDKSLPRTRVRAGTSHTPPPWTIRRHSLGLSTARQQLAVSGAILPITHGVDKRVDYTRGPSQDRRKDMDRWKTNLKYASYYVLQQLEWQACKYQYSVGNNWHTNKERFASALLSRIRMVVSSALLKHKKKSG